MSEALSTSDPSQEVVVEVIHTMGFIQLLLSQSLSKCAWTYFVN